MKARLLFNALFCRVAPVVCLLGLSALLSGCKTWRLSDPVTGPGYQPENYYHSFKVLPVSVRRVACLPATCDSNQAELLAGLESLDSVVVEEFGKTQKFEVVTVTPGQLRAWIGRSSIRAEEALPANLLEILKEKLQCDGVLFSKLTRYRAFPPLAVGFSFKLAEADTADLLWAADEVFDATDERVVNSARRYQLSREQLPPALADSRSILNSPSGFGRYAASSLFQTLPVR